MDKKQDKMLHTPINRLVAGLAAPTIVSMLITTLYNMADSAFVGRINTSASGAIGIVLVIQAIIQAFGFTFGHGSGSIISRMFGRGDSEGTSRLASTGFFLAFMTGIVIAVVGFCCFEPLLLLLGSTDSILPYAKDYAKFILLAAPFMASSCVLNNIIRYEGRALLATVGLSVGGILNIILDPIFMFVFDMGISGAGVATALSQIVSFSILLYMFLSGKTRCRISLRLITRNFSDVVDIFTTGIPSLIRQGLNSFSTAALNNGASHFGDPAIAAMSIVGRICMFIASVMIGIGQGLQPVAAYNFGAGQYKRVRKAFDFTLTLGEIAMGSVAVIVFIFAPQLIAAFRNDPAVVAFGVPALHMQCVAMLLQPLGVCTNMTFQSIGERKRAAFIASLRSGLFFLPLIFTLPHLMGKLGIQSAQAIADTLTFLTALPMAIKYFKRLPPDIEEKSP